MITILGWFLFYTICISFTLFVFANFFEWGLHRYVMHKRVKGFEYPFKKHAMVHHQIFKADETYHLINMKDKETIPMAWWNGPALIIVGFLMSLPFSFLFHTNLIWWDALVIFTGYYGAYEYLHMCMHLPKRRRLEFSRAFRLINGHHLLHHRYQGKNFNVVCPLADFCMGTLILRSKIKFPQATGPSVPDVQPVLKKLPEASVVKQRKKIVFLELP